MSFQLRQLVAPAHCSSLPFPGLANPSNPPTAQDVCDALTYSNLIWTEHSLSKTVAPMQCVVDAKVYEHKIIAAYGLYIAQVAVPAPAPGLPLLHPLSEQARLALVAEPTQSVATSTSDLSHSG